MKKILYLLPILLATILIACNNDDGPANLAANVAGLYHGTTNARCAYFSDQIAENQIVSLVADGLDKVNLSYTSDTWGTFSVDGVTIVPGDGKYILTGSGVSRMGMDDNVKEYDCTFTGTVIGDCGEFTFACPAVMGGLTIEFTSNSRTK